MMRITGTAGTYTAEGNSFKGYVHGPFGSVESFDEMENMCGKSWPVIRTRDKRKKVRTFAKFHALFGHDRLGWIDGTDVYYAGAKVGTVTDSAKVICEMGALVCVWPDKKIYNTVDGSWTGMEQDTTVTGTVTYTTCDLLGEAVAHALAVYVKVAATGISAGFKANDVIDVSGSDVLPDGAYQIYTVEEDSFVVLATMDEDSATQSGGLRLQRTVPDMDYMTQNDNRIWGCSNTTHELYACALGDPTNWYTYQGLATDAYALTVGTPGAFTGIITHLGYVLVFKEDAIHKVFGNKPSNFQLTTTHARGVEAGSEKSLCIMNETLYYLSPTGMVGYEGSLPGDVAEALGDVKYKNAVCGAAYGRLFASMQDDGNDWHLFTYDGRNGYWYREDNSHALEFRYAGGTLYMAKADGTLWALSGPGDPALEDTGAAQEGTVSWKILTGDLRMEDLYKKHLQKIMLRFRLAEGATCTVKVNYDSGSWETVKAFTGKADKKATTLPLIPRRCDHMRIRLEGSGEMRLLEMNCVLWNGSDL